MNAIIYSFRADPMKPQASRSANSEVAKTLASAGTKVGQGAAWLGGMFDFLVAAADKTPLAELDQAVGETKAAYKKALDDVYITDGLVYGWMHSEGAIHGAWVVGGASEEQRRNMIINTLGGGTHVFPKGFSSITHWVNRNTKGTRDPVPLLAAGDWKPRRIPSLGEVPIISHPQSVNYVDNVVRVRTYYSTFGDDDYVHGFPTYAKYVIVPLGRKYFVDNAASILGH